MKSKYHAALFIVWLVSTKLLTIACRELRPCRVKRHGRGGLPTSVNADSNFPRCAEVKFPSWRVFGDQPAGW